jgi:hypothetical protein
MKPYLIVLVALGIVLAPNLSGAVEESNFEAKTTRDLMALCTADSNDPLFAQAVNFCHGYLVGAYHYYQAVAAGPDGPRLVCLPDPAPTRNEAIAMFIEWARNHPEHWDETPVETEFRFLTEKWPCKP